MNDPLTLAIAWAAGVMLGAMFFGGLWWTVRKGMASRWPAVWFVGSLLVRLSLSLAGMYVVSGGQWARLVLCLVGFVMARLVVMWLTRVPGGHDIRPAPEAGHAP